MLPLAAANVNLPFSLFARFLSGLLARQPAICGNFVGVSGLCGDPKHTGMPLTQDFEPRTHDALTRLSRQHRLGRTVSAHCSPFSVFGRLASTEGVGDLTSTVGKCGFESRRSRLSVCPANGVFRCLVGAKSAISGSKRAATSRSTGGRNPCKTRLYTALSSAAYAVSCSGVTLDNPTSGVFCR
jgi:hypothetical protein